MYVYVRVLYAAHTLNIVINDAASSIGEISGGLYGTTDRIVTLASLSQSALGCGSPVVKVSNHGRHVMSSIQVPLKTRRVGQRCTLNLSRAETSSRWCGVVVRRGVPAQQCSREENYGQQLQVLQGHILQVKLWSNQARVTSEREDRHIHHMSGGHCNASTAEIMVFVGTTMTFNKSVV
ncbi:uncharacterized protein TNCV_4202681 [Trichonephila clavipes]|uniref:Uncharacterized protein n=1 Tax=Trichonephila clavipes TaxID=2585209 RepID=A0A8X6V6T6_TRICX|nr:uncharacterized protein TNCV_4202681 [Trichonephila clavipes]